MNRFIKYFFLLICLLPKLAVGMELVVNNQENKEEISKVEIVKKGKKAKLTSESTIEHETDLCLNDKTVALPLDVWFQILKQVDIQDQIHFMIHSKVFAGQFTFFWRCKEFAFSDMFGKKLYLNDASLHDVLFDRLYVNTKNLSKLTEKDGESDNKVKSQAILENNKENACEFLTSFKSNKGGFDEADTLKYEAHYIYLSNIYGNDYDPNNCCVPCGVYSKKSAKACFKPVASCLHGTGSCCMGCAEGSLDFVTSSSGGPATLCCLGVCCCPVYTPVILAAAVLFVGFAIPCCCYSPCYCAYACYDFNKDD